MEKTNAKIQQDLNRENNKPAYYAELIYEIKTNLHKMSSVDVNKLLESFNLLHKINSERICDLKLEEAFYDTVLILLNNHEKS